MKFYSVEGQMKSESNLNEEYRSARAIGGIRVGSGHLFFRAGLRVYAAAWSELRRCYRRVMRVPMKMCCGSGNLDVESLVIEGDQGEIAQIQLPGSRAARALMALLKEAAPDLDLLPPAKGGAAEASL